ncbi:MAG TPA: DHHA1 domain-containing protein, partial [Candidatus Avimonas sp.]|nr:DHHA1 domain-containing protein [Candidatus Avimonas sp.]
ADILARAQVYGNFAVAVADSENGGNLRVAAAQAADELLYIQGVDASFVIFPVDKTVNISARSLGRVNVQVLMEQLGGGGHFNMAGAQLAGTTPNQAKRLLLSVIRKYTQDTSQR